LRESRSRSAKQPGVVGVPRDGRWLSRREPASPGLLFPGRVGDVSGDPPQV